MIKFTDIRPTFTGSETYMLPNEYLPELRKLIADLPNDLPLGGSIASGGEVPLTVILPKVQKLKVVDHNYGSLWWTCVKILLLRRFKYEELLKEFARPNTDFNSLIADVAKDIELPIKQSPFYCCESARRSVCQACQDKLKAFWTNQVTPEIADEVRERLDVIELIHGDIRDLGENLDLLYISNALSHSPFDGNYKALDANIKQVLAQGAIVLMSGQATPEGCRRIKFHHGTVGSCQPYSVARRFIALAEKPPRYIKAPVIVRERVIDTYYRPPYYCTNTANIRTSRFDSKLPRPVNQLYSRSIKDATVKEAKAPRSSAARTASPVEG